MVGIILSLTVLLRADAQTIQAVLTSAIEVRRLAPEEARRGYLVRFQAVVLYYNRTTFRDLMVDDSTAGIYIAGTEQARSVIGAGDVIEIEGATAAGDFAPMIVAKSIRFVRKGQLPAAREVAFDRLASGVEDGQWIKIHGIIRYAAVVRDSDERLMFDIAVPGGRLTARVPEFDPGVTPNLIDAEATVTGICYPVFNRKRQLLNIKLSVPSTEFVHIDKAAPNDPFERAALPINRLLQFSLDDFYGHRVKVAGVVTLHKPGEYLFIKDETQGLWVKTRAPGDPEWGSLAKRSAMSPELKEIVVGDRVEALGFPAFGEYTPVLEDAIFRKVGQATPPTPTALTAQNAGSGDEDAELIQLSGRLIETINNPDETALVLQEGDTIFRAHLPRSVEAKSLSLRTGSRLQVAGVCLVQRGDQRAPQSFRLLLRSPADIRVLQQPSWWTFARVLLALGAMTVVSLGAMAWIVTLRRRVSKQTEIIRQKIEREAVLEERTRIARDFHDTLEQQLAGIGMQLQTACAQIKEEPEFSRQVLEVAQSMVRHTQSEAKHSVWDLRARALENGNLSSALSAVAAYVKNGSPVRVDLTVVGDPRALPRQIENNLLRIGQEAVANAIRHGEPRSVRIDLCYATQAIELSVEDDGKGFSMEHAAGSASGHFGLMGMKERAERIGARLEISAASGRGAKVKVSVPLTLGAYEHDFADSNYGNGSSNEPHEEKN